MKTLRLLGCMALTLTPFLLNAAPPPWWTEENTRIIEPGAVENNYAPVNLGQLKHVATQAKKHLDAVLPGGAGPAVDALVSSFEPRQGVTYTTQQLEQIRANNRSPANVGQVKAVAIPFYDRLMEIGYVNAYPWTASRIDDENYAIANIGQIKRMFSFDVRLAPPTLDSDNDGLPDDWENYHFGNLDQDGTGDYDGDGLSNADEFANKTLAYDPDSDKDGIPDGWETANGLNPKLFDSNTHLDGNPLTALQQYQASDADSDADLMPDKWERAYGMDPHSADEDRNDTLDTNDDFDGDGILNVWEYRDGTNPRVADGPPTGRVVNLTSTPTSDGGFDLSWDISFPSDQPFTFQRRRQDGTWRTLITAPPDARRIHVGPELLEPTDE